MSRSSKRFALFWMGVALSAAALAGSVPPPSPAWQQALDGAPAAELEKTFQREAEGQAPDALAAWGYSQSLAATGERERAVMAALEGILRDPGHPAAFLLEDSLTEEAFFNKATTERVEAALPTLLQNPALEPIVRFNLRWLAYRMASRRGDPGLREASQRSAGFPDQGLFAVVDTPTARLDFAARHAIEAGDLSALPWTPCSYDMPVLRPPSYAMPQDREAVLFSLLPFRVSGAGEAILYLNGATTYRVYLDGKEVLARDFFRRQENPTAAVRLRLGAGEHRLLLKTFIAGPGEGVHLALLDGKGDGLRAEWLDRLPADPIGARLATSELLGNATFRFLEEFPKMDPRFAAFKALFERWLGDVAKGRLELEKAASAQPKSLLWRLLVAQAYLFQADDLPTVVAQSRAESAVDAVAALDPSCPMARFYTALMKQEGSDSDEDVPLLESLVREAPGDPRWGLRLASRYHEEGWVSESRTALKELRIAHPDCEEVETAWLGFASSLGDRAAQQEAIARLGRLRYNGPERENFLENTLQWDELKSLLKEEIQRFGDRDLQWAKNLARLEARAGDYAAAEALLREILKKAPEDDESAFALARLHFLQGREAEGRALWAELKKAKPKRFQIDLARWMEGEQLPFEEMRLPLEKVLEEDRAEGPEQAPSSLLLDQQFTRVEPDGSSLERYHGVIRINDKEGVDREGEQALRGQVVLSVRTVKPDGRILEPESIPEKRTLSMQGLEPGDLIEYETLSFLPSNEIRRGSYITAQVFLFQDLEKPFHRTQWVLEYPKAIPFQFFEQNLPAPAQVVEREGTVLRNWDFRAMPRLAPEPNTPYKTYFVPLAEAVGGITWPDIGRFLANRMVGAFQITPELSAASVEAMAGAKGQAEKAEAVVRFVSDRIDGEDGGEWQDPTLTLLTRRGSRIPVACALLDLAGVPHKLLLAEPVVNRVERQDLPRVGQFTVPVLEIAPAGAAVRRYTLDSPHRIPDALPWYLQGARAIEVTGPEPWKVVTLPSDFGLWRASVETQDRALTASGDLQVHQKQVLDPDGSESLRTTLQRVPKDQHERVLQMALSRQFGNAVLERFSFKNLAEAGKPLEWEYDLKVRGYGSGEAGRLVVPEPLPPLGLSRELASLSTRTLPLATGGTLSLHHLFKITLPQGARTDFRPPSADLKSPFGEYTLRASLKGSVLILERTVWIPFQVIQPSQYPAFREFLAKIDEAEAGQLVLTLPEGKR